MTSGGKSFVNMVGIAVLLLRVVVELEERVELGTAGEERVEVGVVTILEGGSGALWSVLLLIMTRSIEEVVNR